MVVSPDAFKKELQPDPQDALAAELEEKIDEVIRRSASGGKSTFSIPIEDRLQPVVDRVVELYRESRSGQPGWIVNIDRHRNETRLDFKAP